MDKVYKSKVAKWYVWFCIGMTIAFIGSIFLCYQSTWVLLIDVVLMGVALFMMYDMLLHTDYTISGENLAYSVWVPIPNGFAYFQNYRDNT